eukprot:CAMPEP_0194291854 /NCGR_PEP_ID=MMETSP0169-20130528/44362_1 /TAXON_ID=218684 /ORGANISM="Corethron pennatum, Strain L29A3" /LENGTH=219 /DNA_ID=CAMNT_0039039863 /DNA_START=19 /DNA_END=678 /DNA_ORIENTATION=+
MGRRQSAVQVGALVLLLASSVVIEGTVSLDPIFNLFGGRKQDGAAQEDAAEEDAAPAPPPSKNRLRSGVLPVLGASFISGLAGALAQRSLQGGGLAGLPGRNSQLFTMEISFFSALTLALSMAASKKDRADFRTKGFFHDWTPWVALPITVNAAGGVLVGLVTKHAGSVRKGFSLIGGLFLTGVIQAVLERKNLTREQYVGSVLAMISMYLHLMYPYLG